MALIKTDYGLVYNDDGKLRTTKRNDNTPFQGVTSYAVETSTENKITFPVSITNPPTWGNIEYLDDYTVKLTITDASAITTENYLSLSDTIGTIAANTDISFSCNLEYRSTNYLHIGIAGHFTIENTGFTYYLDHIGKRYYRSMNYGNDWGYSLGIRCVPGVVNGDYIIISYPQIEIRKYPSSFVRGARPNGRLVIPTDKLGFNPGIDDWVISYWKYPIATHDNTLNGFNLFCIGDYNTSNGVIYWGKYTAVNQFRVLGTYNDDTNFAVYSSTFDSSWYFRNWHYEVIMKHEGVMEYWVDGIQQIIITLTKPLYNAYDIGAMIGGFYQYSANNSLVSNLTAGKYDPIWTPEYIQEVYQAKKPYHVPPKMYAQ